MKIATWNINGIRSRIEHVTSWSGVQKPDVLCVQETKCVDKAFPVLKLRKAGFEHIAIAGESSYNGVAILSKLPIEDIETVLPGDDADSSRRFLSCRIGGVRVVNVYVPHGTAIGSDKFDFKLNWIERLGRYLADNFTVDDDLFLLGDLNIAPHETDVWNPRLWQHKTHFSKRERDALLSLKKWGFVDVFRQFSQEPGEYSWWSNFHHDFEKNRGLRIDHIWASPPLADRCLDCWIDRTPRSKEKPSDHAPVIADFAI